MRVKKTIYSLDVLSGILLDCNRRYLDFLSALEDFSAGNRNLEQLTTPKVINGQKIKGFNFFDATQQALLRALQRPEFNLRDLRRSDLIPLLPDVSISSITRQLWRLRKFGIIKKIAHSYRYRLTQLGRSAIAAACRLTEQILIPAISGAPAG